MVKTVAPAPESTGAAGNRDAAVTAKWTLAECGQVIQVQVDVVGDVQIKIPVIIVVAESRAGAPLVPVADPGLLGHISKRSVVIVVVKRGAVKIGDVQIFPSIVVVITGRHPKAPSATGDSSFGGYIGEGAVVIIVIELAGVAFAGARVFKG